MKIIEQGLIPIYEDNSKQVVNARELHEFLEIGKDFSNWIKDRIEKYGFIEGEDFSPILAKTSERGGRPSIEYILTLDTAKEIAMVENNENGRKIRKYFIEVENRTRNQIFKPMSPAEILAGVAQVQVELEHKVIALDSKLSTAIGIFSAPVPDTWRHDTNEKINKMCLENGLSYLAFKHEMYSELENVAKVNLSTRQLYLRQRMKKGGSTYAECKAISKLDIVERDSKLMPIFDGIVRKYQAKYVVGV